MNKCCDNLADLNVIFCTEFKIHNINRVSLTILAQIEFL